MKTALKSAPLLFFYRISFEDVLNALTIAFCSCDPSPSVAFLPQPFEHNSCMFFSEKYSYYLFAQVNGLPVGSSLTDCAPSDFVPIVDRIAFDLSKFG